MCRERGRSHESTATSHDNDPIANANWSKGAMFWKFLFSDQATGCYHSAHFPSLPWVRLGSAFKEKLLPEAWPCWCELKGENTSPLDSWSPDTKSSERKKFPHHQREGARAVIYKKTRSSSVITEQYMLGNCNLNTLWLSPWLLHGFCVDTTMLIVGCWEVLLIALGRIHYLEEDVWWMNYFSANGSW